MTVLQIYCTGAAVPVMRLNIARAVTCLTVDAGVMIQDMTGIISFFHGPVL